jgi:hypothetical protein
MFDDFKEAPTENELATIVQLAERQLVLEDEVAALTAQLETLQDELRTVQTKDLPEAMEAANVKEFTLTSGKRIKLEEVIRCNIPNDKKQQAFAWLDDNGASDLIKTDVSLAFTKGEKEKADKAMNMLLEAGFAPQESMSVHWRTMSSWAKEQLSSGKVLPSDLLGLYIGKKSNIK